MSELDDFDRSTPLTGLPGLDFGKYGDQWIGLVARYLAEAAGITSHTISADAESAVVLMRTRGGSLSSGLLIRLNGTEQASFFVLSHGEVNDEMTAWKEAAQWAFDRAGNENSYDSWAVISQDHESPASAPLRLTDRLVLDGITVEPTDFYREFITPRSEMHVRFPSVSQLLMVKFKSRAYDFYAANQLVAGQARHLTGLLSVAFGAPWMLRMGPNPGEPGADFVLPAAPKHQIGMEEIEFPPTRDIAYPDWIGSAWGIMARKPWLSKLVVAFQEGLLLAKNHGSYAAMALVAIIEQIGNHHIGLSRCNGCDNCDGCGQVTGSKDRFRASLARAIPTGEAEHLADLFYRYRSGTAHRALLHGQDQYFGAGSTPSIFTPNPACNFSIHLFKLCDAAHKLLLLELGVVPPLGD